MKFPQIGEVLPNGHTVDAGCCIGSERHVLAHRDDAPEPYVVWSVDQDGDTWGGKYFTDQLRAQRYFASCCYDWINEEKNKSILPIQQNCPPIWVKKCLVTPRGIKIKRYYYTFKGYTQLIGNYVLVTLESDSLIVQTMNGIILQKTDSPNPRIKS